MKHELKRNGVRSNLFRVFAYAQNHKLMCAGTLACALGTTGLSFVFPNITEKIIDEVIRNKRPELLIPSLLVGTAAFFGRDILNCMRIRLNNTLEQKIAADLRRDLYEKLQKFSVKYFDERSTGEILNRMQDDVTNVERLLVDGTEQGLVATLQILAVGTMLFLTQWKLAFAAMIPIPFLIVVVCWFTVRAHKMYKLNARKKDALSNLLHDNIQGIRQIKIFGREDYEIKRFGTRLNEYFSVVLSLMRTWSIYWPLTNFIGAMGSIIVVGYGGHLVTTGQMQVGELIKFLLFLALFYEPLNRIHGLNQFIQSARTSSQRVFEILDEVPTIVEKPDCIRVFNDKPDGPFGRAHGAVKFEQVWFQYQEDRWILNGINVDVPPGHNVALVGPTGAGKSTLINLIPRFHDVSQGRLLVDGVDVRDYGLATLRKQIGIVSQEPFLFNGSIRDNIMYGNLNATEEQLEKASKDAFIFEFIQRLPRTYDTVVGERGVKLSVGEKQRVSIPAHF